MSSVNVCLRLRLFRLLYENLVDKHNMQTNVCIYQSSLFKNRFSQPFSSMASFCIIVKHLQGSLFGLSNVHKQYDGFFNI